MGLIVMGALGLVETLLGSALLVIGLEAAGDAVGGIGEGLLNLVLSGLGGIGSYLLLGLCKVCKLSKLFQR
jgi:hypothetical protein